MRKILVLAAVTAALSLSLSAGAAEPRDLCTAKGGCFDGNWTPKVKPHHAKDAQHRRVERRPARKRK